MRFGSWAGTAVHPNVISFEKDGERKIVPTINERSLTLYPNSPLIPASETRLMNPRRSVWRGTPSARIGWRLLSPAGGHDHLQNRPRRGPPGVVVCLSLQSFCIMKQGFRQSRTIGRLIPFNAIVPHTISITVPEAWRMLARGRREEWYDRKIWSIIVISSAGGFRLPACAMSESASELVAVDLGADDGRFNRPIAVDGEGMSMADTGNDRSKFDNTGAFLQMGQGVLVTAVYSAEYRLDADGMVYVVDGSRIQVFAGNGTFIKKWGSYGSGEEQLQSPRSIAFDTDGNAYVIAGGGIKKFGSDGNFLTAWGALGTYDGEFNNPTDVAVDGAGKSMSRTATITAFRSLMARARSS